MGIGDGVLAGARHGGIHGVLDVRGCRGPVGVGRRRVGTVHVYVMHAGQGTLPRKNRKSAKGGAEAQRQMHTGRHRRIQKSLSMSMHIPEQVFYETFSLFSRSGTAVKGLTRW